MRPRKTLLPLTLDNLTEELEPGRPYTVEALACIFDASRHSLLEVLETATAAGTIHASRPVRGFRRTYWVSAKVDSSVAGPRWLPNLMTGDLAYSAGMRAAIARSSRLA